MSDKYKYRMGYKYTQNPDSIFQYRCSTRKCGCPEYVVTDNLGSDTDTVQSLRDIFYTIPYYLRIMFKHCEV